MIDSKYVNEENNDKHILLDRTKINTSAYVIVDKQTENRPDLISLILCNDMSDMDIFSNFNGIIDLFDIPEGMVLEVPVLSEYYANTQYFELPITDMLNNNNTNNTELDTINNNNNNNNINKSPNLKRSTRSNYTIGENGVFIF